MRLAVAAAFVCLAAAVAVAPARSAATLDGCRGLDAESVLERTRAGFHDRPLRPYVVYTISRREIVNGLPDFWQTYQTRVWYRSKDGTALTRRVHAGRADGPLVFERPRFNAALDPGPPTADIFEPAPPRVVAPSTPQPESTLLEIASVSAHVESDYRPSFVACDAKTIEMRLDPRRDPDRNRLRTLWIERGTWNVERFVSADRLYHGITDIWDPDTFDGMFGVEAGVPVIRTIHAEADSSEIGRDESNYRFDDVSFPDSLPDWYFQPQTYRAHVAEAPN